MGKRTKGRCACGALRYEVNAPPLIVHACHCRNCRRLTGGAFVVNLWIEAKHVVLRSRIEPRSFRLPAGGGRRQDVFFCERCGTQVWSSYSIAPGSLFVRAGALERPESFPPDVHIFTRSKLPSVELPAGARAFRSGYQPAKVWSAESLARLGGNRRSRRR